MGFYDGAKILTNGLILSLDAADRNSYSGSGTSWFDMSGNNNTFTLKGNTGTPTYDGGNGGNFSFNSSNYQYADLTGTMTGANSSANFSITLALNFTQNVDFPGFFTLGPNAGGPTWTLQNMSTGYFRWYVGGTTADTSATGFNNGKWCIVTLTIQQSTAAKIYVNAIERLSTTNAALIPNLGSSNYMMGAWGNSGYGYNGRIALCHIYNRTLSAAEVLQNYQAQKSRFGL